MRRALITVTATVAGTVAVLTYHPGVGRTGVSLAGGSTSRTHASGPGSGSGAGTSQTPAQAGAPAGSGALSLPASGSATGPTVTTRWGPVQVRVQFSGGRIADVQALQLPNGDGRSVWISQQAEQILRQEVLQAQSANVDMVSGATYTSGGYIQSLQAALDSLAK